jgi:hypothetical protein
MSSGQPVQTFSGQIPKNSLHNGHKNRKPLTLSRIARGSLNLLDIPGWSRRYRHTSSDNSFASFLVSFSLIHRSSCSYHFLPTKKQLSDSRNGIYIQTAGNEPCGFAWLRFFQHGKKGKANAYGDKQKHHHSYHQTKSGPYMVCVPVSACHFPLLFPKPENRKKTPVERP